MQEKKGLSFSLTVLSPVAFLWHNGRVVLPVQLLQSKLEEVTYIV